TVILKPTADYRLPLPVLGTAEAQRAEEKTDNIERQPPSRHDASPPRNTANDFIAGKERKKSNIHWQSQKHCSSFTVRNEYFSFFLCVSAVQYRRSFRFARGY